MLVQLLISVSKPAPKMEQLSEESGAQNAVEDAYFSVGVLDSPVGY